MGFSLANPSGVCYTETVNMEKCPIETKGHKSILFYHNWDRLSRPISVCECPNAELKEVKEGKRDSSPWMTRTIAVFLQSETVVGLNKNSKNCLEIFQFSGKASASPCQRRDIMAQISVDTFHCEGVILIVDVVNMLSWIDYVQISLVSICTVILCLRSSVNHPLDCLG
jgi:hypothetical protein